MDKIIETKNLCCTYSIGTPFEHVALDHVDFSARRGEYIGIIWAICAIINPMHEKMRISAEPSFAGSVLDGYGENNLEIYPLKLLVPTVKLILNSDVRKLIRGVLDER